MAVFNVPVTIGVNEEDIARQIKTEVKDKCIANIYEELKKIMFREDNHWNYGRMETILNDAPLRNMVEKEIEKTVNKHSDLIIEMAATKLADKLSRSKAVREKAAEIAEDVYNEQNN